MGLGLTGFQIGGVVSCLAFLAGLTIGELHGRDIISIKWEREVAKTDQAAGKLEEIVEDKTSTRQAKADEGKVKQRAEDTVSRITYNNLKRDISNERIKFKADLDEARKAGGACNCVNIDMPISLQRKRTSERPPSPD